MAEISCLLLSWNYGCFLAEALESVLACDPGFSYVLVVDDASTDNTAEVAQRFGKVDYVRNDHRLGTTMSLNRYLTTMPTEWVVKIDADDWILPRFVAAHSEVIDREGHDPRLALVYAGAKYVVTETPTERPELDGLVIGMKEWDPVALRASNFITGSAVIRRDALIQVGGFVSTDREEDLATWRRFAEAGFRGVCVNEVQLMYRQHARGHRNWGTDSKRAAPGWRAPEATA